MKKCRSSHALFCCCRPCGLYQTHFSKALFLSNLRARVWRL